MFLNNVLEYENLMYVDTCNDVGKVFKKIHSLAYFKKK